MARRPPAARTAFGPMIIAAVERFEPAGRRILDDPLAIRFLPPPLALLVRACRWHVLRDRLVRTTERKAAGLWGGVLCRKRYADDQVAAAVDAGIDQLVVLGAGMDTRASRTTGVTAYEVDLPANLAAKRAAGQVRLVPIDLETGDLLEALAAKGFRLDRPAMFTWEAVTQYLTEDGVRRTLAVLAKAAPGSRLVLTYVRRDFLDGTNRYGADGAYADFVERQRLWHFGLAPEEVGPLLAEYGWTEREQLGAAEYRRRYVEPAGRDLAVSEIERFVGAAKG
ncbi:SAM-dependent methyltransferase [Actinophytocola sp.]|uniref:SAM-dependent methyltransferase n=1 Tax=Actinophytocola sp. TaxID=1872138 RepID=UPI002ED850D7